MNLGKESESLEFKKSTAERKKAMDDVSSILNKCGGGTLYFGVAPNGDVVGQQISPSSLNDVAEAFKEAIKPMIFPEIKEMTLDGKTVIKATFAGNEKTYSSYGRYYKRVFDRAEEMTPEELREAMSFADPSLGWENNLSNFGIDCIDHKALLDFYQRATSCGRLEEMSEYDESALLSGLGLLKDGFLNNAGLYLFSNKHPVVLKVGVFVTDERINFADINRFNDNIYNLIRSGIAYVKSHINWRVEIGGDGARVEIPEVPVLAIREIVVNSFAHADYRSSMENEIDITPTRIEIFNPGEFSPEANPESFAFGNHRSIPRNKLILEALYKCKDVEAFGSGLRKTYASCQNAGVKVEYKSGNGGFEFVFLRGENTANDHGHVHETTGRPISGLSLAVFEAIKENPTITGAALSLKMGKSVRTITRCITELKRGGYILRVGNDRIGQWEILKV